MKSIRTQDVKIIYRIGIQYQSALKALKLKESHLPPIPSFRDTFTLVHTYVQSIVLPFVFSNPRAKFNHKTPKLEAQSTLGAERPLA